MIKKNHFPYRPAFTQCLAVIIALVFTQQLTAQTHIADSSKRVLLAATDRQAGKAFFIKESNVIFPEILKGNEEQVNDYIEHFCEKRKDYVVRMYKKGKVLLPKAASILKKHDLPEELKVLLTLESAYNGNAVSSAGAVGYWQFMDVVAKEYGLKYVPQVKKETEKKVIRIKGKKVVVEKVIAKKERGKEKDDRKNFNKATAAAARYLRDRRRDLDDNWLLVVASYNCGVGNVWSAMERTQKDNPTFWEIKKYLPAETQAYVMNFITLNVIFNNYDNFLKDNLIFKPVKIIVPDALEQVMSDGSEEPVSTRL